jgi:hypothetical protein
MRCCRLSRQRCPPRALGTLRSYAARYDAPRQRTTAPHSLADAAGSEAVHRGRLRRRAPARHPQQTGFFGPLHAHEAAARGAPVPAVSGDSFRLADLKRTGASSERRSGRHGISLTGYRVGRILPPNDLRAGVHCRRSPVVSDRRGSTRQTCVRCEALFRGEVNSISARRVLEVAIVGAHVNQ